MVRQHALMESISANLHGFLHKINRHMKKPDKKFIQDALIGLLRAGRPIVCQSAARNRLGQNRKKPVRSRPADVACVDDHQPGLQAGDAAELPVLERQAGRRGDRFLCPTARLGDPGHARQRPGGHQQGLAGPGQGGSAVSDRRERIRAPGLPYSTASRQVIGSGQANSMRRTFSPSRTTYRRLFAWFLKSSGIQRSSCEDPSKPSQTMKCSRLPGGRLPGGPRNPFQ